MVIPLNIKRINIILCIYYKYNLYFSVCAKYSEMISGNKPPHVILDTTKTGVSSETVKSFTAALSLPTVSACFGQEGDLRQWRTIDEFQQNYLLQIMPPADIIPESVRSIVKMQSMTNAAILFDNTFGKRNNS